MSHFEQATLRKKSPCFFNEISGTGILVPTMQGDSKLLLGFPWPMILIPGKNKRDCLRNMKAQLKKFYYI
jgi:hypothetical protein